MTRKKYQRKHRGEIEKRLELAEKRLGHYENQKATFGDLYVPAHILISIENEKRKIALIRRQLTQIEKSALLYSATQRLKLLVRTLGDIVAPYDSTSRRRRTKILREIRSGLLLAISVTLVILLLGLYLYSKGIISRNTFADILPGEPSLSTSTSVYPTISSVQGTELRPMSSAPASASASAIVANTYGKGVRFRLEPRQDAPSNFAISEGTTVFLVEKISNDFGEIWWKVQLESGEFGYIWEVYLRMI